MPFSLADLSSDIADTATAPYATIQASDQIHVLPYALEIALLTASLQVKINGGPAENTGGEIVPDRF